MKEWLRFSICFWHTFRGRGNDMFGEHTMNRTWNTLSGTMEEAKHRIDAAFELFKILGVE